MGDIFETFEAGPFPKSIEDKLNKSRKLKSFFRERDGYIDTPSSTSDEIWIRANDRCADYGTHVDLLNILKAFLPDGVAFSMSHDVYMIGSMGLEEEDCGTMRTEYLWSGGAYTKISEEWTQQDFS